VPSTPRVIDDRDVVEREPTRTFSSVLRPGSITMKNGPPDVTGQAVTVPVRSRVVSLELIEDVSVQAADAPEYDLLAAYAI